MMCVVCFSDRGNCYTNTKLHLVDKEKTSNESRYICDYCNQTVLSVLCFRTGCNIFSLVTFYFGVDFLEFLFCFKMLRALRHMVNYDSKIFFVLKDIYKY